MNMERLVKLAKEEEVPEVDVADKVMERLQSYHPVPSLKPMGFMAAVAAMAACIIMSFAVHSYKEQTNPLYYLFASETYLSDVMSYDEMVYLYDN